MEYLVSLGGLYASVLRRDFFINEQADHDPILASSPRGLPQRTSSLQSLFRSSELIFKREATCSAQSHDTSLSRCFQRLARQWTSALSSVFSDPRSWRSIPELLSLAVPDETLSKHPETEQVSHVAGFCEEVLVEVAKSVQSYRENFELGRRPVTSFGGPPSITSLMETERKMRSAPGDIAGTVRRADPAFRQFVATHLSNTLTRLQSQRLRTSGTPSSLFDTAHNTFQPLLRFAIQLAHAPTPFPPRQGELSVYARPTAVLSAAAALGSLPLPPPPPPPPLSARRTGLVSPRKRALLSPIPLPEQLSPQRQQLLRAESPLPLGLAANPGGGSTVFQSVVAGAKRGAAR
ncbi:hypothetical protein DFJ73DRAFT_428389 [Zopfochytrium polystomum]|nr:hypothetical protein DFJ73DRAFT_428389 [Zopfochytrium polystomum]